MKRVIVFTPIAAVVLLAVNPSGAQEAKTANEPLFATVNGKPITQKDFQNAYNNYLRDTYYHQQVPQDRIDEARKEAGQRVVDRELALEEAARRGLVADEQKISQTIAEYEARYAASPMWQNNRESLLPGLKRQLAEQDLLRQIETIGHAIDEPSEAAVREYYEKHPDLFTEPEKMRLHVIMLKVDPSSPRAQWEGALEEGKRIVARLKAGDSFEDLARLHSQDLSAEKGGDMGYLHRGMIPAHVQAELDARPMGQVGDAIEVLEGVGVFRLDDRLPAKRMEYEQVAARARALLKRERTEQAWKDFLAGLRGKAVVRFVDPPATKAAAAN